MEVISANLAGRYALEDADGNYAPFRRRMAIFASGDPATGSPDGVHVREVAIDQSDLRRVYDPGHKFADKDGYVGYPNIDPAIEMVNALEASRAYEANITAAEATKAMMQGALRILA